MPEELPLPIGPAPAGIGAPREKKPLFKPKQAAAPSEESNSIREEMNSLSTRLRVGEERYSDLRRKLQLIEQNMLKNHKRSMSEVKTLLSDINEIKKTISVVESRIILAIKELQLTAKKEDVDVLKKYLDLWNPVKFVTINQVEKMIQEAFAEEKQQQKEKRDR